MKKVLGIIALSLVPVAALASGAPQEMHDKMSSMAAQGIGKPGDAARVDRDVEIVMNDTMRFTPARIEVKKGQTIRFQVRNAGKIPHEMVIGSAQSLKEHAAEMRKSPAAGHAEPSMLTLEGGRSGALVWRFDKAGKVEFACLVPGHMEAGMVGEIVVK